MDEYDEMTMDIEYDENAEPMACTPYDDETGDFPSTIIVSNEDFEWLLNYLDE